MAHLFCIFLVRFLYNLQQSCSPRGNLLAIVTSLPSFIHYCKHDELWGCAEILLDLTSSKFRVDGDVTFFFGTRDSDLIKMSFAADKAWIVHFPEILSRVLLLYNLWEHGDREEMLSWYIYWPRGMVADSVGCR